MRFLARFVVIQNAVFLTTLFWRGTVQILFKPLPFQGS